MPPPVIMWATLHADVRYQIEKPKEAITQIDDIENSIKEIAEISISQIVSHHNLADFAPATSTINFSDAKPNQGIGDVIKELTAAVTEQLAKLGIKLLNIGITSWKITDSGLAHELAQGAVVKSQTQSKLLSAENAAQVKKIEVETESNSILILAEAQAQAIIRKGQAYATVAKNMGDSPIAQSIYQLSQQTDMVSHAKNANLFFAPPGSSSNLPTMVTPIPNSM